MASDRWLTYPDAAALLGMTPESVRQRARREHWGKKLNNEGKALVLVPVDAAASPPGEAPATPPASRPVKHPEPHPVELLQARIKELEARIVEMRGDVDTARADRDQERQERHAERERADQAHIRADEAHARADRIAAEFRDLAEKHAGWIEEGRVREATLREQLDTLKAEVTAHAARPWWKRLVG